VLNCDNNFQPVSAAKFSYAKERRIKIMRTKVRSRTRVSRSERIDVASNTSLFDNGTDAISVTAISVTAISVTAISVTAISVTAISVTAISVTATSVTATSVTATSVTLPLSSN